MQSSIFLVGPMGAGKTTIGRMIAQEFVVMLCPIRRLFVSLSRVRDVDVEERSANDVRAIQRRD